MTTSEVFGPLRQSRAWPRLVAGLLAAALVLALIPIYATAWRVPAVGLFRDDGVYVVTAKALAEGRGYRIISLPDEPRQTKYPPLFPAVLAVLWKVGPAFPANLPLLKAVPLLAAVAWFGLTAILLRRLGVDNIVLPLLVVALASLPYVVYLSTTLLSEMLFAALCTGALICLETLDDAPSGQRLIVGAVLAAAATMTRTTGLAVIAGGAAWLLLARRDVARCLLFTAVAAALLIPWLTWVASSPDAGYYGASNYRDWNVLSPFSPVTLAARVRVVAINTIWTALTPAWAIGAPMGTASIALTSAMLIVGALRRDVYRRASAWFVAAYLGMVIGWAWPPWRFVLMVLPLLAWMAIAGMPRMRYTSVVVAGGLAIACVAGIVQSAGMARRGAQFGTLTTGTDGERWSDVLNAATWIRTHTTSGERLVCNLDPLYYLLTDRKATRGFEANPFRLFYGTDAQNPLGTADEAWAAIRRARGTLIVETPDLFFAEGPHLKSRYAELEARGLLTPAGNVGPIRFLRAP